MGSVVQHWRLLVLLSKLHAGRVVHGCTAAQRCPRSGLYAHELVLAHSGQACGTGMCRPQRFAAVGKRQLLLPLPLLLLLRRRLQSASRRSLMCSESGRCSVRANNLARRHVCLHAAAFARRKRNRVRRDHLDP